MDNKYIALAVTLAVGVILAGSVLMPVVEDAQRTIGEEVTYSNTTTYGGALSKIDGPIDFKLNSDGITINGEPITMAGLMIISDYITINTTASDSINTIVYYSGGTSTYRPSWGNDIQITYANGEVTFTSAGNVLDSGAYEWAYVLVEDGDYIEKTGNATVYVNSLKDVVAGGYFSSDTNPANSTYYAVENGKVSTTNDFDCSISGDLALVDGTTDVYRLSNFTVTINGESFHPYYWIVKENITGHKENPTNANLLGVIPLMVIVALLLFAVQAIRMRND